MSDIMLYFKILCFMWRIDFRGVRVEVRRWVKIYFRWMVIIWGDGSVN